MQLGLGTVRVVAEMTGDRISKNNVVCGSTGTDVVEYQRAIASWRMAIGDDADMGQPTCQPPRHQIAGAVVHGTMTDRQRCTLAGQERFDVGYPPVVDVLVGRFTPPALRIRRKILLHVLMNQLLEIDAEMPVGSNDDISANATIIGNITARVGDGVVGRIVDLSQRHPRPTGCNDRADMGRQIFLTRRASGLIIGSRWLRSGRRLVVLRLA